MNNKNSKAFENGRAKALREIEERIAAKLGGTPDHTIQQQFANAAPRTAHERLGFGCKENEVANEKQAFQNAAKLARASDGFFIPTPADVRKAMERSKTARAELHKTVIENRKASMRRLGLGRDREVRPADDKSAYGWFDNRERD